MDSVYQLVPEGCWEKSMICC